MNTLAKNLGYTLGMKACGPVCASIGSDIGKAGANKLSSLYNNHAPQRLKNAVHNVRDFTEEYPGLIQKYAPQRLTSIVNRGVSKNYSVTAARKRQKREKRSRKKKKKAAKEGYGKKKKSRKSPPVSNY